MAATSPIRILVAEDEFLTLEGIVSLLAKEPDFAVVGTARTGQDTLSQVRLLKPHVLLLDIRMPPGMDGIEVIRTLRQEKNNVIIVALTQEYQIIEAVRQAGANGYLPKDEHHLFIASVRCVVLTGSTVFINPKISKNFQELQARVARARLTPLETETLKLLNFKNEEIARRLGKSSGRIRNLITDLYFKLEITDEQRVTRRVQAMELARLLGILETPHL